MNINKSLYFATILALTSCGNGNQVQNEQPKEEANTPTVEAKEEPKVEEAAIEGCNEKTAFVSFYKKNNPFYVLESSENIEKDIEHSKTYSKAVLANGKVVDVKFKEYQAGEENAGAFITDQYRDEWTGIVYESSYKPQEEEESGYLFSADYMKNHRPAIISVDDMARLSGADGDFIAEHYPNLTVAKPIQTIYLENGEAKIFTVQFEPSGDKTLAINVFVKDDKYFVNEDWGRGDKFSTWNVDDEGEYVAPIFTVMVANDKSHYDLYYCKSAVESFAIGKYNFKQDSIIPVRYAYYYQTVDYQSKKGNK